MIDAHEKWLANDWKESKKGGVYLKTPTMFVCVFQSRYDPGCWTLSYSFGGKAAKFSKETFGTIRGAQIGLFNRLYR